MMRSKAIVRGGRTQCEIEHGRLLLRSGEASVWGWDTPAGRERVRRRCEWLQRACGLRPGIRVLECGCGTGIFTRLLAATGADITAVDISPDLLARAREHCRAENIHFVQGDLEAPHGLEDMAYDAIYGVSVLHHLDVGKALPALRSKLKPGARFAFSEPNLLNPINKYYFFVANLEKRRKRGVSPTEMAFRPVEFRDFFIKAGYSLDALDMRDFMHPSFPARLLPVVRVVERFAEQTPLIRSWSGSLWASGRIL